MLRTVWHEGDSGPEYQIKSILFILYILTSVISPSLIIYGQYAFQMKIVSSNIKFSSILFLICLRFSCNQYPLPDPSYHYCCNALKPIFILSFSHIYARRTYSYFKLKYKSTHVVAVWPYYSRVSPLSALHWFWQRRMD